MKYLLVTDDQGNEQIRKLRSDDVVIGRAPNCDLTLPNRSISRRHARLKREEDGWFVEDMDSHNGIMVNGEETTYRRLRDGDVIQMPHYRLEMYVGDFDHEGDVDMFDGESIQISGWGVGRGMNRLKFLPLSALGAVVAAFLAAIHVVFGVVSIMLSLFALGRISADNEYTGAKLAVLAIAGAVAISGGRMFLDAGGVEMLVEIDPVEEQCRDNMETIWGALQDYRRQNDGAYPGELHELVPEFIHDREILRCPGSNGEEVGEGYRYLRGRALRTGVVLIVDDGPRNHGRPGACVLYEDGEVEVLSPREYERLALEVD